jgi:hypothetical protein
VARLPQWAAVRVTAASFNKDERLSGWRVRWHLSAAQLARRKQLVATHAAHIKEGSKIRFGNDYTVIYIDGVPPPPPLPGPPPTTHGTTNGDNAATTGDTGTAVPPPGNPAT